MIHLEQYHCLSFAQKNPRSQMFSTMINGDSLFAERKERKVKVPFSSKAVEMMVKFIYGIELEEYKSPTKQNLDVFLELIEICGVYGIKNPDKDEAEKIKPHVNKENVFYIFSFAHLQKTDDLKKICMEEITGKFSEKAVLDQKAIIDCPEMGVEIWKLYEHRKTKCHKNRATSSQDILWQVLMILTNFISSMIISNYLKIS